MRAILGGEEVRPYRIEANDENGNETAVVWVDPDAIVEMSEPYRFEWVTLAGRVRYPSTYVLGGGNRHEETADFKARVWQPLFDAWTGKGEG